MSKADAPPINKAMADVRYLRIDASQDLTDDERAALLESLHIDPNQTSYDGGVDY